MKKSTSIIMVVICALSYFIYDRYIVQPKELNLESERMLSQIAFQEQWFDVLGGLSNHSNGSAILNKEIDSAFKDENMAYVKGKIVYISETTQICKIVDFKFKYGSLNDYEIFSQSDCAQ